MVEKRHGRSLRLSGDRKEERFTSSLLHHVSVDLLRLAFFELKRNAAPGVDGLTWQDYEADLELRLADLPGLCVPLSTLRCRPSDPHRP
jgi:RNA-directed DNA polymerase